MKLITEKFSGNLNPEVVSVELTRRNLLGLLAKLDEPGSQRTLLKVSDNYPGVFTVVAVEDEAHYASRQPGPMSSVTEAAVSKAELRRQWQADRDPD